MKRVIVLMFGFFICGGMQAQTYLEPPQVIAPDEEGYQSVGTRRFQGISSLAVTESGRIWAVWYAGPNPREDRNNYVVLATSGDDGESWREVLTIDPDRRGPVRAYDPEIWIDPQGRLRVFWAQMDLTDFATRHQISTWVMTAENADAAEPVWSPPRQVARGVMMCKPIVLENGDWLLPISDWRAHVLEIPDLASATVYESTDNGETFSLRGRAFVPLDARTVDEHMLIERKDGSLWLLARTKYGIGESFSHDGGKTWSDLQPSKIPHTPSRFFIRRLDSGNLLLVKHGRIDKRPGRSQLTASVSKDDGESWQGGLMLDERGGVSYPDGQQVANGTIYITYDYSRTSQQKIYMTTFTEEDVLAGEPVSGKVRQRIIISGAGGPEKPDDNADGQPLVAKGPKGKLSGGAGGFELKKGAKLFTDRDYQAREIPDVLSGAKFLRVALDGQKSVECTESGMIHFLTPKPNRNRDSQTDTLTSQGLEMVAIPEIPSFDQNTANYCTLYQKMCEEGEVIEFGKWAIPVFSRNRIRRVDSPIY